MPLHRQLTFFEKVVRWVFAAPFVVWSTLAGPDVTIQWDRNPESNVVGYRVYWGQTGGATNVFDVGNETSGKLTDLEHETSYFFYVTAYNDVGLESDPSGRLTYEVPAAVPLAIEYEENILAIAPVGFQLPVRLTGDAKSTPNVNWRKIYGPDVGIWETNRIDPTIFFSVPGDYSFRAIVSDGSSSLYADVTVKVLSADMAPDRGDTPLTIEPLSFYWDGVAISWGSKDGAIYHIGRKRSLNEPFWALVAGDIFSFGDGYTYWVDDTGSLLRTGFYTVFEE